jgi:DNA polymerase-3 subunit delta'
MIEAHAALVRLGAEAPIFNYEPPMLAMEMGALLASASGR